MKKIDLELSISKPMNMKNSKKCAWNNKLNGKKQWQMMEKR